MIPQHRHRDRFARQCHSTLISLFNLRDIWHFALLLDGLRPYNWLRYPFQLSKRELVLKTGGRHPSALLRHNSLDCLHFFYLQLI